MQADDGIDDNDPRRAATNEELSTAPPPRRLLDQIRDAIRYPHHSFRTEEAYVEWVRRFVLFHGKRHPRDLGGDDVAAFLTHLAVERNASASTHQQTLSALLFLYRDVLALELPWLGDIVRLKSTKRLPVVLARAEVHALLAHMDGTHRLMARLLYGTGMRLMECMRLRVKDLDLRRREITGAAGTGCAAV